MDWGLQCDCCNQYSWLKGSEKYRKKGFCIFDTYVENCGSYSIL